MKTFNELLKESNKGVFVVEQNELTEIHVDYANMTIEVREYRTKNQLTPDKKSTYSSLAGKNFGTQSVEEKFNELINNKF
jgi:hypothetical protein